MAAIRVQLDARRDGDLGRRCAIDDLAARGPMRSGHEKAEYDECDTKPCLHFVLLCGESRKAFWVTSSCLIAHAA